jgi:hypothetical protein
MALRLWCLSQDKGMGIEDIEIPEVPIPVRILAEKRAAARRAKRTLARKQSRRKVRTTTGKSVKKAS